MLSLFLHLADRPAELSSIERLNDIRPRTPPAEKLTWHDIFGDGDDVVGTGAAKLPKELESEGGSDTSYGSEAASDDGLDSDASITSLDMEAPKVKAEDLIVPTDNSTLDDVQEAQAWRRQGDEDYASPILEAEALRECLNTLRGLPSVMFGDFKPNGRYYIETLSSSGLYSILALFCQAGKTFKELSAIESQLISPVQRTFRQQVDQRLLVYSGSVTSIEKSIATSQGPTVVSLFALQAHMDGPSRELTQLAEVSKAVYSDVSLLNRIYDVVCETQAIEDEQLYQTLAPVLHACLASYLRPVLRWVTTGQIDSSDETFFVQDDQEYKDLSLFWEQRYKLRLQDGEPLTPDFLRPFVLTIFSLGKQVAFISELGMQGSLADLQVEPAAFSSSDLVPAVNIDDLTPYSSQLAFALTSWIESCRGSSSVPLKHHLQHTLGLSRTVDTLAHVYLSADGSLVQAFGNPVFARLDAGRRSWNDRWFLDTCAHDAFVALSGIDGRSRNIEVKTSSDGIRHPASRRVSKPKDDDVQSVKALSTIGITLDIHPALQNIVRPHQMTTYQAASTFLLQLYRGRSALANLDIRVIASSYRQITLPLRQRLLHTLNTMTSHFLHAGIGAARDRLDKDLHSAEGIDAMIAAHGHFIRQLEHCCLLMPHNTTVREAIIKLCDLAVSFANSKSSPQSAETKPRHADDNDEEEASDISDDEPVADHFSRKTTLTQSHETDPQRLRGMLRQHSQLQAVIIAGLRSASRAESGDEGAAADIRHTSGFLGMLAEELESSIVSRRKRGYFEA